MKVNGAILILTQQDVMAAEKMLALRAEAQLAERPPMLERVGLLEEFQLSSFGLWQRHRASVLRRRAIAHRQPLAPEKLGLEDDADGSQREKQDLPAQRREMKRLDDQPAPGDR